MDKHYTLYSMCRTKEILLNYLGDFSIKGKADINMNKIQAIEHLQELKELYKEYESIETKEEDIKALDVAIEILREAVQESKTQEQLYDIYPTQITLVWKIDDGMVMTKDHTMIDSYEAIQINVKINSSKYYKDEVYECIKALCEQLKEYFH